MGLMILCAVILHQFKVDINLFAMSVRNNKKGNGDSQYVKYNIISNIGTQNILKMEMVIPYENIDHRRDLKRKMKRIKDDFFVKVDQRKFEEWVLQRDFAAIKNEFLKTINQHTNKPVENIYFESFIYY